MKCSRTLCFLIFIIMVICGLQNVASSCTLENVTLIGYGLLGGNLIRRSYLSIAVINLTKSSNREIKCYDGQAIILYYSDSSMKVKDLKITHNQKSVIIMQKIL